MISFTKILKGRIEEENSVEVSPTLCPSCAHRDPKTPYTCTAFPQGIPVEILMGLYDHMIPHEGDNGVTFERRYPVEKGEGLGHPFRGNQYTGGLGGGSSGTWNKIGAQKGSNPGGIYENNGVKHYVKFPNAPGQAMAEQVADKIHALMGVQVMNHQVIDIKGQTASVSKLQQVKELGQDGWDSLTPKQQDQAAEVFMASALTKNWDVVGMTYDNMGTTPNGDIAIIDTGGSFQFRAQGGRKEFGGDAHVEIENMLSQEKTSGRVFGPLYDRNPQAFEKASRELVTLTKAQFSKAVEGMPNADGVVATLMKRQMAIASYFDKPGKR